MKMNEVIRKYRREAGLTQEQVANYLGVTAPAVNKWESGSSCPDIAMLSPLARLLGIDLNTLCCFREELSEQEVGRFVNEIAQEVEKNGIAAGFELAEEKIREFPQCDILRHQASMVLEGSMILSGMLPEEKQKYMDQLMEWYERTAESEDEKLRMSVLYLLAGKYMQQERYEKAQEMLERMPERNGPDKRIMQAELDMLQGKAEQAAKKMEQVVMGNVQELQLTLLKLLDAEIKTGELETARQIAEIYGDAAEALGMWKYNKYVAFLEVAVAEKNAKESVRLFECLLDTAMTPWNMGESPLYRRLYTEQQKKSADSVPVWEKMLLPLVTDLEYNPRYDFMREDRGFQELIEKYRARCRIERK